MHHPCHPYHGNVEDHRFHCLQSRSNHHDSAQDLQSYSRSQPRNMMQEYNSAPVAEHRISELFPLNQGTAASYNNNRDLQFQRSYLSYDTVLQPQSIRMRPFDTQAKAVSEFRGSISFAEMIQTSRRTIMMDGTKQFYANLCPLQDKYLGKRAKHWGITGSEEPLSQETFQMIVEKLAQPERSS